MFIALHHLGHLGSIRGQSISYIEGRICESCVVHLPLGKEGPNVGHRNKYFLSVHGSELLHGYQPVPKVVPNLV